MATSMKTYIADNLKELSSKLQADKPEKIKMLNKRKTYSRQLRIER